MQHVSLRDKVLRAKAKAIATKGPYKGHLKRVPPRDREARCFWNAAMMVVNPHKVEFGFSMTMSKDELRFHNECERFVSDMHSSNLQSLDKDRMQLDSLGVW